ncbi:MAG: rhodanese-like domain-containing protein [Myxococcota bacterium]|nr:rhodanese-like domain-containing protein [Myxococcota bacterium]
MKLGLTVVVLLAGLACGLDSVPGAREVAPEQLLALTAHADGPLLLDVRSPAEFDRGRVPGARNVPISELPARLADLEPWRERGVVVYCEAGPRAERAAGLLGAAGFETRHLSGDMAAWRASGRAVEQGAGEP